MNIKYIKFLCVLSIGFLIGCSEKENIKVNHPPIAKMSINQTTGVLVLDGSPSNDPDGNYLNYKWSTTSDKISISSSTLSMASVILPINDQAFNTDILLEVSDGKLTSTISQTVLIPTWNQLQSYGLGKELTKEFSDNTKYEWYYDQGNSGAFSSINCGPTVVTMASKWANQAFSKTPLDARNTYRPNGGWWYNEDIFNYLNDNSVNHYTIALTDINLLKEKIETGSIVILCLDMYYTEYQSADSYHVNKFYNTSASGWGHYIIIKGYKEVDGATFFEAYDPYSLGREYSDNSLKGKDRYYNANGLNNATDRWWDYAIIITKNLPNGKIESHPDAIDPTALPNKSGQ